MLTYIDTFVYWSFLIIGLFNSFKIQSITNIILNKYVYFLYFLYLINIFVYVYIY